MPIQIAEVSVDNPLPHLDRPFDYAIPSDMPVSVGCRVRVRFAGRKVSGYVLGIKEGERDKRLLDIESLVSDQPALSPEAARLCRAVADHYAGTLADVLRLAVPPRHARAEASPSKPFPEPSLEHPSPLFAAYPYGDSYLSNVKAGGHPRAVLSLAPVHLEVGSWTEALLEAAQASIEGGRGALLLTPDAKALDLLAAHAESRFGRGTFTTLSADLGPSTRYRHFMAVKRGNVKLVLGTLGAAFAPVQDLGLVAVFDSGRDTYSFLKAPYPHVREVAMIRSYLEKCALLLAGYSRTAEETELVRTRWAAPLKLTPAQNRSIAPAVRTALNPVAASRDPLASGFRLPPAVFEVTSSALLLGPVLIQVARAGHFEGDAAVSVQRTAQDLGRAFPGTKVVTSHGEALVAAVDAEPKLVVATPQAEPQASGGYAAAVILDVDRSLTRADLRVEEESLRRWLDVASMVKPADEGGTVLLVGEPSERVVQALIRLDPVGFSESELAQRAEAGFPPVWKLITLEGPEAVVQEAVRQLNAPKETRISGPYPLDSEGSVDSRATLRAPLALGSELVRAVKAVAAERSSRKLAGPLRVAVDPERI
ncbi:MAG: primosome assembly protein PriA [Propionibacteriaceae bacterium]|jgi:primosomal protein N' (replication factor Y)|nr:primosome assembly protein PriA [Propionibacteriaceae bacterium]